MEFALEIQGLTKKYDGFTLDNLSISLPGGCSSVPGSAHLYYTCSARCAIGTFNHFLYSCLPKKRAVK